MRKNFVLILSLCSLLAFGLIPAQQVKAGAVGRANTAIALGATGLGLGILGAGLALRNTWRNRGFGHNRFVGGYGNYAPTTYWSGYGYPVSYNAYNYYYPRYAYNPYPNNYYGGYGYYNGYTAGWDNVGYYYGGAW